MVRRSAALMSPAPLTFAVSRWAVPAAVTFPAPLSVTVRPLQASPRSFTSPAPDTFTSRSPSPTGPSTAALPAPLTVSRSSFGTFSA